MSSFSVSSVYAQLTSFANLSDFWSLFNTAFGSNHDSATAAMLRSQWQSGNFRNQNLLSCAFEVPKQEIHICLTTKCLGYLFFIPKQEI